MDANGLVRIELASPGGYDLVAYQSWSMNEPGFAGYRIRLDPANSFAVTQIDCFSARKNGDSYEKVQPYSVARFDSFEQLPGGVSLPRLVTIDQFSQITKERDPELLKARGFFIEPAESYLTKRIELRVKSFRRLPKAEQSLFEPIFPEGTTMYDELTATDYIFGKPAKDLEKISQKYKAK
jgi:hypothetical protein